MTFARLAWYFQKLEETASRNLMTEVLADLFKEAEPEEIDKICYLAQGRVVPLFVPLEFGMADKMVIKAISRGFGAEETEVVRIFREEGDLGKTAERLFGLRSACRLSESSDASVPAPRTKNGAGLGIRPEPVGSGSNEDIASRQASPPCLSRALSVAEVFEILNKVAHSSGGGSVEQKIGLLGDLFNAVDSLSARYLARIPLGKLRLGFSDMTILDALSWMLGEGKRVRPLIEKAYNVRPDLGFIARAIKLGGVGEVGEIGPKPGTPILMARAERLSSGQEIIEKIGKCAVEPKIDGFRLAVHIEESRITLFSRNMEDMTPMFPDLVEGIRKQVMAKEAILEGEAIAYDTQTGEYLPFQETVQRKRKYDIEQMAQSVPLKLICFDCLYVDGKNLIHEGYLERRKY
ncbi:hypothetical protein FJZ40_04875, partial [Candidatus Shapirobacteria bacterium]|nr:hypothetical protein [Candidatus Shapirobacteria bacterium]